MKKRPVLCLLLLAALWLISPITVFAAEDSAGEYWQQFVDALPEGAESVDGEEILSSVGVEFLFAEIISALTDGSGQALSFLTMLLGIAVLTAVAESASPLDSPALSRHAAAGVSMISAVLIFGRIGSLAYSVRESLESLSAFFSGLIPILTGILSAGGNINSAAAQALNMNIALGAVSYVCTKLMIPLAFALFALALASGTLGGGAVSAVAKSVKGLFNWILGIGTAIIIAAVSMQSVVAGAQDSAYLRAAKYAASGIPVVGSTVSSALATLAGGLSYVKSAVGVSSVAVIVVLALSPLVTLMLYRLAFSLAISFLEFIGTGGGTRSLIAFRSALDALIAVYALSSVVYISEIIVFMKSGVSVFG